MYGLGLCICLYLQMDLYKKMGVMCFAAAHLNSFVGGLYPQNKVSLKNYCEGSISKET